MSVLLPRKVFVARFWQGSSVHKKRRSDDVSKNLFPTAQNHAGLYPLVAGEISYNCLALERILQAYAPFRPLA